MQLQTFFVAALLALGSKVHAQALPEPAGTILQAAQVEAAKENKKVFVIFHASWCGWCRRMDSAMNDVSCKELFRNNYVISHLVVHESPAKKKLETPGALEMLQKYKGDDRGVPSWFIMDSHGVLLAGSRMDQEGATIDSPGKNIGCPATEEEIAYFLRVLKSTSALTAGQLAVIGERFGK